MPRTTTTYEEALEAGFLGTVPDPIPNEAYSLQTGPDSPSAVEQREALAAGAPTEDAALEPLPEPTSADDETEEG